MTKVTRLFLSVIIGLSVLGGGWSVYAVQPETHEKSLPTNLNINGTEYVALLEEEDTPIATETVTPVDTETFTPTETETATPIDTDTPTPSQTDTPTETSTPTRTPSPTATSTPSTPVVGAPLCPSHDPAEWHSLWDASRGCHYDHEHGTDAFTSQVASAFPGFDLVALLGGNEIPHSNPSSPMEFTHKHGGFKVDVILNNPHGCVGGFEGATYCVKKAVFGYHALGDYSIEFESRIHSIWGLLTVCRPSSPNDCGTLFTIQHADYGQRTVPYQGTVMGYPDTPLPAYGGGFGPYLTIDCVGVVGQCRSSLTLIRNNNLNTNSKWSSNPTGSGVRPTESGILRILFNVRDTFQVFDWSDQSYPFTFKWICSSDNGATYNNPVGCRYNNTTTSVDEAKGTIPASWDNLAGFDTNPTLGRITAQGFVTRFGILLTSCTQVSDVCFPIKMENMFIGSYGDYLDAVKPANNSAANTPERDICRNASNVIINCDTPGAIPLGWVGNNN